MTKPKPPTSPPTIILYGLDADSQPHACVCLKLDPDIMVMKSTENRL